VNIKRIKLFLGAIHLPAEARNFLTPKVLIVLKAIYLKVG